MFSKHLWTEWFLDMNHFRIWSRISLRYKLTEWADIIHLPASCCGVSSLLTYLECILFVSPIPTHPLEGLFHLSSLSWSLLWSCQLLRILIEFYSSNYVCWLLLPVYVSVSLACPRSVSISTYTPCVLSTAPCNGCLLSVSWIGVLLCLPGRKGLPWHFMPGQPWSNAIRESACCRTDTTWEEKWRQYCVCFIFVKSCSWANRVRHDTAPLRNSQGIGMLSTQAS